MFGTLKTLRAWTIASADRKLQDTYSIELIEQKTREAVAGLKAAKVTLAGLIQRKRSEVRQVDGLRERIVDLETRAKEALDQGREDLAQEAAHAIAAMENEMTSRLATLDGLEARIVRLEGSVAAAHRRIEDLKHGLTAAKALRREREMQVRLGHTGDCVGGAMEEAEALIGRVMGADDPFERSEILREIDQGLTHDGIADRMAAEGVGRPTKATASDVLARLKAK